MTDYIKVNFTFEPFTETEIEILEALLCNFGYDSFEMTDNGVDAYTTVDTYSETDIQKAISLYGFQSNLSWNASTIKGADWNEVWEQESFKPMIYNDTCIIHSPKDSVPGKYEFDISLTPRMSFGSGHHETTRMMIEKILDTNLHNKKVLDMGTGTGVLAILCAKKGAQLVDAIEIDETAYLNANENSELNHTTETVTINKGDASLLSDKSNSYDLILANINRNIIINDFKSYANSLNTNGCLYLSGFYSEDIELICEKAKSYQIEMVENRNINEWQMIVLSKNART